MRPLSYRSDELRSLLLRTEIATLDELKQALGAPRWTSGSSEIKPPDYCAWAGPLVRKITQMSERLGLYNSMILSTWLGRMDHRIRIKPRVGEERCSS
jgi:hypothetical protein